MRAAERATAAGSRARPSKRVTRSRTDRSEIFSVPLTVHLMRMGRSRTVTSSMDRPPVVSASTRTIPLELPRRVERLQGVLDVAR